MVSIQELIQEVTAIKQQSEELSTMVAAANVALTQRGSEISSLVMGSRTGQEAVMALGVAARSTSQAAAAMRTLGRTCDDCIRELSK